MTDAFNFQGSPLLYLPSFLLYVTSVISPVFYITDYFSNQIFPFTPSSFLPFPPSFFPFLWIPAIKATMKMLNIIENEYENNNG